MNREASNHIRFVIEELLPPIVRDSGAFKALASAVFGDYVVRAAEFRKRAPFLTAGEYEALYRNTPELHSETDNSRACLEQISGDVVGVSICDVGCGTGYLLEYLAERVPSDTRLAGVDFIAPGPHERIGFFQSKIETLPFEDKEFDTVVCTHVVEHILDYRRAIAELRRIARKRLIVVVPREREGRYTFNPHFNFFPYAESFLRAMIPVPPTHRCFNIGRDIYYVEDL